MCEKRRVKWLLIIVLTIMLACFVCYQCSQYVSCGNVIWPECPSQCSRRCSRTQYHKPCMFFCQKCCRKCLCVPPGYYGNKAVCPCYNNWKTKEGGPKCPWASTSTSLVVLLILIISFIVPFKTLAYFPTILHVLTKWYSPLWWHYDICFLVHFGMSSL